MDAALRRQLAAAIGSTGLGADDVVHPANLTQLREVITACALAGVAVAPRGAEVHGSAVTVDVDNLDWVLLNSTALLLHAGAAATWSSIRDAADARRLSVSGLPSLRSDRVGDSVAAGEIAHRTLAGVELLTNAGELISAGGRTLKDVVGYDLAGLALGSGRRLGMIAAVTLRLDPAGSGVPPQPGPGPWRGEAFATLTAAFGR